MRPGGWWATCGGAPALTAPTCPPICCVDLPVGVITTIRIVRVITDESRREEAIKSVQKFATASRIDAGPEIVVSSALIYDVVVETSEKSEVCFLGIKSEEDYEEPLVEHAGIVESIRRHIFLAKSWDSHH